MKKFWSKERNLEDADVANEDSMREDQERHDSGPENSGSRDDDQDDYYDDQDDYHPDRHQGSGKYRDEIFSKRVPAGKRTYFFDVKTTRSGKDYFLTITESKRVDEHRYEKHKIFLYKEDFGKFVSAMHEVVRFIQDECLPGYEFRGLPDVSASNGELDESYDGEEGSF